MPIKHVDTKITVEQGDSIISMRFADNPIPKEAKASVELKVPFGALSLAGQDGHVLPGTYAHTRFQIAALR